MSLSPIGQMALHNCYRFSDRNGNVESLQNRGQVAFTYPKKLDKVKKKKHKNQGETREV